MPVSSELIITSDNEIYNYKFMQPSTDPNCWLDGLRVTARRSISAGEVLTFEYSTLYGDDWSNLLKKKPVAFDWKGLLLKYEGHVSKFVVEMASKQ